MTLPAIATIYVTNHCQHQCPHCFLTRGQLLQSAHLHTDRIFSYLNHLSANKVFLIALAGGDPFLHPDIEKIIRKVVELKMLPLLGCNPSEAFKRRIPLLGELKIKTVQFSLDSPFLADHDRSRGDGSFDATLAMIRQLAENGIKSNLSICITNRNAHQIDAMIGLADRIGIFKLKLVFWEPDGLSNAWSVSDPEKLRITKRIASIQASRPIAEWVVLPDYDLTTAARSRYSMPELIANADGNISSSDFSKVICSIDDFLVAENFARYVEMRKASFLQKIIDDAIQQLNKNVFFYSLDLKLRAAAAVLVHGDDYHIFIENGLPPIMRELNVLHEIGHIKTGTLAAIGLQTEHEYLMAERSANRWLLSRLGEYLGPSGSTFSECLSDFDFTEKLAKAIHTKFYIF